MTIRSPALPPKNGLNTGADTPSNCSTVANARHLVVRSGSTDEGIRNEFFPSGFVACPRSLSFTVIMFDMLEADCANCLRRLAHFLAFA